MTNPPEKKPSGKHHFTQLKPSAENYSVRNAVAAVHVEQPKHLDRPTSGAEITEVTSSEKYRFSFRATLRLFGKKRDPIYGVATDLVEQTGISRPIERFVPDEPIIDGLRQDENIVILERGISAVRRQDAANRPDTAACRPDTTESQGYNATKGFRQTAIISSFSVPDTRFEINLLQQPLKPTFFDNVARPFLDNVAPPFFRSPLPLNKYFNSTLQLAFARHLLLAKKISRSSSMPASLSTVDDSTQAMGLEGTDLMWIGAISKDPIEQDRLRRLTALVALQFLESRYKDAKSIAEVILLGSVLDHQDYRGVLSSLIRQLEQEPLLELALLVGVVYFLESAPPGYLIDDDLVRILRVLRKRLEDTHMQLDDTKKPVSEPIYQLAIAISRVLDKMVQCNIKGLRRTEDHRPLLNILAGLKDSPDLCLKYQATCAWQALQYIGDDESPLDMAVRVGGGLVMAGLGVASAFKLDIEGLFNGLRELGEAAGQIRDATDTVIASVQTAREAGEGVVDSLLKGFRTGNKRAWYPALQGARVVISEGRLAEFRRIVYEAPCCHVQEFQLGICQLLGEIAMDSIWVMEVRMQAVYFLEDLLRSDTEWTTDSSVREAIRSILLRISMSEEKSIQMHFNSLSQDSRRENGDDIAEPYPLITRLPTPSLSPLLVKALKAPSLEYDLHRVMAQRLEAPQPAAYIPPYAKANLTAFDDKQFLLMDKVREFLESDEQQVFLILGDSGSGKSTFNRHLENVLIKEYKQGSRIPIFIHLPAIRRPGEELISKHLETLNFTKDDIQELKRDRNFIIICDSYDESRLSINLYATNTFNSPGQWKVKLIISCRTTHARQDYLDLFQPLPSYHSPSTSHLFQQAVIVPFSEGQIKDYVDQFVGNLEVHKLLGGQPVWSAAEYMDKLRRIPNLLPLVKNPFLLSLSLTSLPVAFEDDPDPSTITITRPKLFKTFINMWLDFYRQRLRVMDHSEATTNTLNELLDEGFNKNAVEFLQNLAEAIYKEQAGNAVVRYVHKDDKETWKAKFFGREERITLLRQSSPLTCVGDLHSFIHRSLWEYFLSLKMSRRTPPTNKRENERVETRPRSISQTNIQQADLLQEYRATNDQCKQNNPPSPLLTPSPHQNTQHIMAFSISNSFDPDSSFTSTNFLANTLERNTLRVTCADSTLDAESDGSESSDDEFEDAQECLSDDSLELITRDEPHKTSESAEEVEEIVEETSWFRHAVSRIGAIAIETGALVIGVVHRAASGAEHAAYSALENINEVRKRTVQVPATCKSHVAVHGDAAGAGHVASGALYKVDGVWKRTVQVLVTRKAYVDSIAPLAKTSYVYYDDEVYDAVLVEKNTGITYIIQLVSDSATTKHYVYVRWGETGYRLDGPYKTIEKAKGDFHIIYHEVFGVQWQERETTFSERFTYKVKTYETFETIEEVEEIVEETEAIAIVAREQEIETKDDIITIETTTTTTSIEDEVILEHVTKDVIVDKKVEVEVDVSVEVDVNVEVEKKKEVIITKETGKVEKTAVPKGTSWFRKALSAGGTVVVGAGAVATGAGALAVGAVHDAASGAGHVASGALTKVDGVWKRTVQVLTTRKAHVDSVAPIAKTSYVYYDDEVYDAVLVEKTTGVTYVTQLLFDSATTKYYVYIRWGETEYRLDGPHETVESAKATFQVTYHEQFGVQWQERETTVSERFTYEVKTYETFETTEDIEEIVEDYEVSEVVAKEQAVIDDERVASTHRSTTSSHDGTIVRTVSEQALLEEGAKVDDSAVLSRTQYENLSRVDSSGNASAAAIGAIFGGAGIIIGGGAIHGSGGASSTTVVEEPKKAVFDFSSLPVLPNVGINVSTGASEEVIDSTRGTAEVYREFPTHLRPRTWVSLHVGGWQDSPHELQGFMRLDDQSGQRLMEIARDSVYEDAQEAILIDNHCLPETVALFARKLYEHFGEELPAKLSVELLCQLGDDPSTTDVQETKKAVFDFSSPPVLNDVGIDPHIDTSESVIDLTSASAMKLRELPRHLRPRAYAWVSLHVGGWKDSPYKLEGFMRLHDQSDQRLIEIARDSAYENAQVAIPIDNHGLPDTVALFARKLYEHFGEKLPAEFSDECLCQLGEGEAKGDVVDEIEAAPSLSFPKCEISGIPESLGDLTITSLVFEMKDSLIFDDESLGAMDLEEEPDILQFLVEQVHEDASYTKTLLWTVYKSLTEGIINQSTKNAACILEKAGIRFQLQL